MKKFARILGLTIALGGAAGTIASACCTAPDPCAESISCTVKKDTGPLAVSSIDAPAAASTTFAQASIVSPDNTPPNSRPVVSYYSIVMGELAEIEHKIASMFVYPR